MSLWTNFVADRATVGTQIMAGFGPEAAPSGKPSYQTPLRLITASWVEKSKRWPAVAPDMSDNCSRPMSRSTKKGGGRINVDHFKPHWAPKGAKQRHKAIAFRFDMVFERGKRRHFLHHCTHPPSTLIFMLVPHRLAPIIRTRSSRAYEESVCHVPGAMLPRVPRFPRSQMACTSSRNVRGTFGT